MDLPLDRIVCIPRPGRCAWFLTVVFGLVWVPAALGQAQPIVPKPQLGAEPTKPETVPKPPKPVLPPRKVQPKPLGNGSTVPKRLPVDINRILESRAGYKTARSLSGQFMAYGPISPKRRGGILDAKADTILIAPDHVVVTAERVRNALLGQLGLPAMLGSKLMMRLNPAMSHRAIVPVVTDRHINGYTYELTLPSEIDSAKLVRALVQVTLLDFANRKPQLRDTEIPLWMTVGFTQVLLAQPGLVLVLSQPEQGRNEMAMEGVVKNLRRNDSLFSVRARLRSRRAFDFSEIAMPSPAHLRGENWKDFQVCSHLLVDRLLTVKAGGLRLQNMIRQLPARMNWQTSFLKVYSDLFTDMLGVEKWWAVTIVQLTGQSQYRNWTLSEAVEKFEHLLKLPAEVRLNDADSPLEAEVTLQQAIRGWDFAVQKKTLEMKINQLLIARMKMPRQLLPFVNEYGRILHNYVATRQRIESFKPRRGQARPRLASMVDEAVRQLDSLDRRLVLFKPDSTMPTPAAFLQN